MLIIQSLSQQLSNYTFLIQARLTKLPPSTQCDVPLVTQFSLPEKAEPTLKKELSPAHDAGWQMSGATSQDQYVKWVFTMCGMACTAMVLKYYKNTDVLPVTLAEDAIFANVYLSHSDGSLSGMQYYAFKRWVQKFNLKARIITRLNIRWIHYSLAKNQLVIVSVNPNIRGHQTVSANQKGGHLVLITGYDKGKYTLTINNPSGFISSNTQHNHVIKISDFQKYFAGRGIIITNQ